MDDRSPLSEPLHETGGRDRTSPPRAPRWVKVFAIVAAVVVAVLLLLLLTGGDHGPGRHVDGGDERSPGIEHRVPHP